MGILLLVRHGQASFGATNYDRLSALGEQQAQLVAVRLAQGAPINHVLSGTLERQHKTAGAIAAAAGTTISANGQWNEYDHVDILADHASAFVFETEAPSSAEAARSALEDAIQRWMRSATGYVESHDAFLNRVRSAVADAAERPGVTIAVSSAGVIAAACTQLLGINSETWPRLANVMVNASVTKIVSGRSGTSMVTFNDHAHLEGERGLITYR
jgi:broad specificity phosphatase PhoE